MRWSALSLFGFISLFAATPSVHAAGEDYGVLIISRERLEVATSCEIGVYIHDQLAARLFQEQSTSFNLPPGNCVPAPETAAGTGPGLQSRDAGAGLAERHAQGWGCVEVPDCDDAGGDVPQACGPRVLSPCKRSQPAEPLHDRVNTACRSCRTLF